MNEVTMFDVRSYLDGEIKPGIFNLLEKMKVKKIEKLISEKTNFINKYCTSREEARNCTKVS